MSALPAFPDSQAEHQPPDERTSIVAAAHMLLRQESMAAVSMADVAAYLGRPTDLIIRWFPTKELLICAVVDTLADLLYHELHQHEQVSDNAVAELFALCSWMSSESRISYTSLFPQLQADFPAAWQRWQEHIAGFPLGHLHNNLRWGMLQEHYHANLDVNQQVQRWLQQLSAAGQAAVVAPHTLLQELLTGIVTPGGASVVQHLQTPTHPLESRI